MHLSTMFEWLSWIGSVHISEIELGLDRIKKVAARLDLLSPTCKVIIVGGTNGKGSTVAGLESIYRAAGYHVGIFTSPILFKHNEQVKIDGHEASDDQFCHAFENIEGVRGDITLTPFEFHTLAALFIFKQYSLDLVILEVGLGGRLDAVNIIDADIAIVTSIAIDHVDWLGSTREAIAFEKAGIFRSGKPAICGDLDPPISLHEHAHASGSPFFCQGVDFKYQANKNTWSWVSEKIEYTDLPRNSLMSQNMSTVLMAITLLQPALPVTRAAIENGLRNICIIGRVQIIPGAITHIYDVSHNPEAVAHLASRLNETKQSGQTFAVFSMIADKDITESIKNIATEIDEWYVAPLSVKRAATIETLEEIFVRVNIQKVNFFSSIEIAYKNAVQNATPGDRIIIFGSFHTVASAFAILNPRAHMST